MKRVMKRVWFACAASCALVSCTSADGGAKQDDVADDVAVAHGGGTTDRAGECRNLAADPHSLVSRNKALVKRAMTELFTNHDLTAIDRYWGEPYIQHNPQIANGKEGLRQFLASMPPAGTYEIGAEFGEGDMVMTHARGTGLGATPLIIVDMFRLKDGKIVEHWDVLEAEVPASQTASGNPMFTPCP